MDANIIPPLIHLLATAEFDIKKEAAWAISNATSGGTHAQIKYFVEQGCIKPLCDLLTCQDARIVTVALEGLENILRVVREPPSSLAVPAAHSLLLAHRLALLCKQEASAVKLGFDSLCLFWNGQNQLLSGVAEFHATEFHLAIVSCRPPSAILAATPTQSLQA
jgi:hypothetical protein